MVVALAAALCLAAASDPAERLPDPAQEARARALFREVRCMVCQNESIADSEAGLAVDLPVATTTQTVNDAGQHIVISVTVDKKWAVEQDEVDKDTIIAAINEKYRDNPTRSLLVKADANCAYEDVRTVMDLLAENNMTTVLIAASKGQ